MSSTRRSFLLGTLALGGCAARIRENAKPAPPARGLRVMTLNLAHGRGRRLAQSERSDPEFFRRNLDVIAAMVRREQPHVVALQEAELGSTWAGNFDHVAHLSRRSEMPYVHAIPHVEQQGRWSYGTAIMSRLPVFERGGETFERPAPWKKGFTLISAPWPGLGLVDFVSVHLDFARATTREEQAEHLIAVLSERHRPLVVMGDFNAGWSEDSVVRIIAQRLALRPHAAPGERRVATFPFLGRRLDWILVSSHLRFERAQVLRDPVSDHRAVVADLMV